MNCGAEATGVWEGVRVCADCSRLANAIVRRNQQQLDAMFVLLKDKIRATLVEGKLGVSNANVSAGELRRKLQAQMRSLPKRSADGVDKEPDSWTGNNTSPWW